MSESNKFGFVIPNLDDIECEAKDYEEAANTLYHLSRYMLNTSKARYLRVKGEVEHALFYEQRAQTNYDSLPDWAKW
jgi:hypothetical protein